MPCHDCPALASLAVLVAFGSWNRALAQRPVRRQADADQLAFFEEIRPVLVDQCFKCHSPDAEKVKAELLLDTRENTRKGGVSGAIIVPGNAERSLLIRALHSKNPDNAMPPKGKLADNVIADFEAWVKMGAPDPREGKAVAVKKYEIDLEKGRSFWAFVPPARHKVPEIRNSKFEIRNEIDAFILHGLEKKGLKPVGDADKRTLIRRVYLDPRVCRPPRRMWKHSSRTHRRMPSRRSTSPGE